MATVRLTQSIKDDIRRRAENLFSSRLSEAQQMPHVNKENGARLARTALGVHKAVLDRLPHGWIGEYDGITIGTINGVTVRCRFPLDPKLRLPPPMGQYQTVNVNDPSVQDIADAHKVRTETLNTLLTEKRKFVDQVKAVLDAHTTLRQALTLWPGLWELLPDYVKAAHNAQVERAPAPPKPKPAVPTVDVSALNGAVVTAKIVENL